MYYNKRVSCDCKDKSHTVSLKGGKDINLKDNICFVCPVLGEEVKVKKIDLMLAWGVGDNCFEIEAYRK